MQHLVVITGNLRCDHPAITLPSRSHRPGGQNTYDAEVALLRDFLGEDTFAAAWAEGKAMSLEQAAAYALEAPGSA
jgi:hypothetical protein